MTDAEETDLFVTAVHEAGHVVVGRHFDCPVLDAYVHPNEQTGRPWLGSVFFDWNAWIETADVDRHKFLMIVAAGGVAVECWLEKTFDPADLNWSEAMSDADCTNTNCTPGKPDAALTAAAKDAFTLLAPDGPLGPDVEKEARRLIKERKSRQPQALEACNPPLAVQIGAFPAMARKIV
jgi:hypothetical protein